jgi:3-hydroxyisobutyrate dehydrogenase-like beta-hydroxyacid dehydrogenase
MDIGFIGLGTMGGRMVANLLRAGHELAVFDIRRAAAEPLEARGARWADSPRAAAQDAELVLTSLPGPREVEAAALGDDGVIHGIRPGAIYADLSTSSASLIRRIHAAFAARGADVLDAPVSGGPVGAQSATLQIMVGGDQAVYERARPALLALGDKVSYMGEIGSGSVAKLVHNLIGICTTQLLAEAFTLGVKAGVRPERLLEAVRGGAVGRGLALSHHLPEVVFEDDFDTPRFALALARKDLGLATELAREFAVPVPLAALAEQSLIEALNRGWGGKDASAAFLLQEERAGVTVRAQER